MSIVVVALSLNVSTDDWLMSRHTHEGDIHVCIAHACARHATGTVYQTNTSERAGKAPPSIIRHKSNTVPPWSVVWGGQGGGRRPLIRHRPCRVWRRSIVHTPYRPHCKVNSDSAPRDLGMEPRPRYRRTGIDHSAPGPLMTVGGGGRRGRRPLPTTC